MLSFATLSSGISGMVLARVVPAFISYLKNYVAEKLRKNYDGSYAFGLTCRQAFFSGWL